MQPPPLKVNLRQDRDFGEVFNATFAFIKQNVGVLAKSVLFFVAPVAAIGAIFTGQYMSGMFGMITQMEEDPMAMLRLIPSILLAFAFLVAAGVLLQVVVLGVMKLYEERAPGQFTPGDVLRRGGSYFLPVLGFSVVFGLGAMLSGLINLIPCLGTILWIIGIVYVGTRLSLTSAAYVLDDRSFSDGMRTSWEIVRPAFWQTFGILIVTWIIAAVLGTIFQLPMSIFTWSQTLLSSDPMAAIGVYTSPWMTVYLVLSTVAQQLLYVIPVVAIGLQYGNLSETVTQSGLMDRLSTFAAGPPSSEEGTV